MRDIAFGATTVFWFNTEDPTGALITLAGSPSVSARNAAGSETTDGVTLSVNSGGTGQHKVTVDSSANPTFYASGAKFALVITAGTVNGVSAIGDFVGEFSIGLIPTAAQNADKYLGRNIAGGSDGGRTVSSTHQMIRNRVVFNDDLTFDVYAEDDTTIAWSGTFVRADKDAIVSVNPG